MRIFFSWLGEQMLVLQVSCSFCLLLLSILNRHHSFIGTLWLCFRVEQKHGQPAGWSECFLALMRFDCTWSMSTVGLTAQQISFPITNPFLRGSYCHSMAGSKPSWPYRHEPTEKWVFRSSDPLVESNDLSDMHDMLMLCCSGQSKVSWSSYEVGNLECNLS